MSNAKVRRLRLLYQVRCGRLIAESSIDAVNVPLESTLDIPNPDLFQSNGAIDVPYLTPLTIQQLEHHRWLFVSVAESAAMAAQQRLQFSPPPPTVPPAPQRMAIAPNWITNLKVKF